VCSKELDGHILRIIRLGSLAKLSTLDDFLFSVDQLLHFLLEDFLHADEVCAVDVEPTLVLALALWLEADVVEGVRDLRRRRNDLAGIRNTSANLLSLGGTWTKLASCKSLLALLRVVPFIKLFLIHSKSVVEATDVLDLQVGFLGSNLRAFVDHEEQLLLIGISFDTVLESFLLLFDTLELLLLVFVEVIKTNWTTCNSVSDVAKGGGL
jgi:hypothetical protein